MAEQRSSAGSGHAGQVPFAQFVSEAPSVPEAGAQGTVTLTGTVFRSPTEGRFTLMLPTGQSLELSTDAVRAYQVVQEIGAQRVVQLQVAPEALGSANEGLAGLNQPGATITLKELQFDQTFKELIKDPIIDRTFKELIKEPIVDTFKETAGDPTLPEGIGGGGGTAAEVPGGGLPGGGPLGGGLTPFVLDTPHHAPQAAVMMQNLAAGMAAGQIPPGLTLKELQFDHTLKELILDTVKELAKDPLHDTLKELTGDPTLPEVIGGGGGGTAVEVPGGGVPGGALPAGVAAGIAPSVWGFPGLLF